MIMIISVIFFLETYFSTQLKKSIGHFRKKKFQSIETTWWTCWAIFATSNNYTTICRWSAICSRSFVATTISQPYVIDDFYIASAETIVQYCKELLNATTESSV